MSQYSVGTYTVRITDGDYTIIDKSGKVVGHRDTDDEAREFIDKLEGKNSQDTKESAVYKSIYTKYENNEITEADLDKLMELAIERFIDLSDITELMVEDVSANQTNSGEANSRIDAIFDEKIKKVDEEIAQLAKHPNLHKNEIARLTNLKQQYERNKQKQKDRIKNDYKFSRKQAVKNRIETNVDNRFNYSGVRGNSEHSNMLDNGKTEDERRKAVQAAKDSHVAQHVTQQQQFRALKNAQAANNAVTNITKKKIEKEIRTANPNISDEDLKKEVNKKMISHYNDLKSRNQVLNDTTKAALKSKADSSEDAANADNANTKYAVNKKINQLEAKGEYDKVRGDWSHGKHNNSVNAIGSAKLLASGKTYDEAYVRKYKNMIAKGEADIDKLYSMLSNPKFASRADEIRAKIASNRKSLHANYIDVLYNNKGRHFYQEMEKKIDLKAELEEKFKQAKPGTKESEQLRKQIEETRQAINYFRGKLDGQYNVNDKVGKRNKTETEILDGGYIGKMTNIKDKYNRLGYTDPNKTNAIKARAVKHEVDKTNKEFLNS